MTASEEVFGEEAPFLHDDLVEEPVEVSEVLHPAPSSVSTPGSCRHGLLK